jgi:hypothetical protein
MGEFLTLYFKLDHFKLLLKMFAAMERPSLLKKSQQIYSNERYTPILRLGKKLTKTNAIQGTKIDGYNIANKESAERPWGLHHLACYGSN